MLLIYGKPFLSCLNRCYIALHVLAWPSSCCRFPYPTKTAIFVMPYLVPSRNFLVLGLFPREESEAKAIVSVTTTDLEVPVS